MKTLIFKMLAIVVAFGGAYASVSASSSLAEIPFVQYTTDGTGDPSCTVVPSASCTNVSGQGACAVTVINGSTTMTTSYQPREENSATTCGALLTHSSGSSVGTKTLPAGTYILQ